LVGIFSFKLKDLSFLKNPTPTRIIRFGQLFYLGDMAQEGNKNPVKKLTNKQKTDKVVVCHVRIKQL